MLFTSCAGQVVTLSLRELQVLTALARRPGRIVSRGELYATVWGGNLRPDDRSVDVYVHRLRAKLGEEFPLETLRGAGYKLRAPAEPDAEAARKKR